MFSWDFTLYKMCSSSRHCIILKFTHDMKAFLFLLFPRMSDQATARGIENTKRTANNSEAAINFKFTAIRDGCSGNFWNLILCFISNKILLFLRHISSHWHRSQLTLFIVPFWANWITFSIKWVTLMKRARRELFATCTRSQWDIVQIATTSRLNWAGKD